MLQAHDRGVTSDAELEVNANADKEQEDHDNDTDTTTIKPTKIETSQIELLHCSIYINVFFYGSVSY